MFQIGTVPWKAHQGIFQGFPEMPTTIPISSYLSDRQIEINTALQLVLKHAENDSIMQNTRPEAFKPYCKEGGSWLKSLRWWLSMDRDLTSATIHRATSVCCAYLFFFKCHFCTTISKWFCSFCACICSSWEQVVCIVSLHNSCPPWHFLLSHVA